MAEPLRPANLAGRWYPAAAAEVDAYCPPREERPDAVAALCPHAGWKYSGRIAAAAYARLPRAETFVLVGVNHAGEGAPFSLYPAGAWRTPAGDVEIDAALAAALLKDNAFLTDDPFPHVSEHSLEVQAPFIARLFPGAKILPLLTYESSPDACRKAGEAVAASLRRLGRDARLVASSDLSHVGPDYGALPPAGLDADAFARRQDALAIEKLLSLDAAGLLETIELDGVTMCGGGAAAVVMQAARALGAVRAEKLAYATSSEVSGDRGTAVGYAGILFSR